MELEGQGMKGVSIHLDDDDDDGEERRRRDTTYRQRPDHLDFATAAGVMDVGEDVS